MSTEQHDADAYGQELARISHHHRDRGSERRARGRTNGYVQRLEAFAERHRARLQEMVCAYGPGSAPATGYGRYLLVGQPESLIIVERMENAPLLMRDQWKKAEEDDFLLDDLQFAWGTPTA
ncbi:hypothetical protein [Streptomyces sp. A 4/2]|uniref:hypothetical protein n=1 Tax=Streptomyces sp. A 4/2 TaxID=2934314 RepID=UPI002024C6D8|nr:hypothetical protein [Streptomyces sp. A 4/2]